MMRKIKGSELIPYFSNNFYLLFLLIFVNKY